MALDAKHLAGRLPGRAAIWASLGRDEVIERLFAAEERHLEHLLSRKEELRELLTPPAEANRDETSLAQLQLVVGPNETARVYYRMLRSASEEVLVFNRAPYGAILDQPSDVVVLDLLERGVKARVLYRRFELEDPDSRVEAEVYLRAGVEARITDELPTKLVVADRRSVLMAGSGNTIDEPGAQPSVTTEFYDPVADQWEMAAPMARSRGLHTATPLGGPACAGSIPPAYCGDIIMTGGSDGSGDPFHPEPLNDAEVMAPAPVVQALAPARGPSNGGHQIVLSGSGLQDAESVSFGGSPAASFGLETPGRLTAIAPPHLSGPVQVTVVGRGGPSATKVARPQANFLYEVSRHPQQIGDLIALASSDSEIELRFTAPPGDGDWPPPADRYLVRQWASPILDDAGFDHARPLCGSADCGLVPTEVGQALTLRVTGLEPATTYHYAIRAGNAAGLMGPISNPASATTHPAAVASTAPSRCPSPDAGDGGAARVVLASGRYALMALPGGLAAGTGALWSWFDQGSEGAYVSNEPTAPLQAGHGYWAWSACSRALEVPAGTRSVAFPLGAYHASMVGNPSGLAPAEARGHDFAARWDPAGNDGAGAYVMSAYRAPVTLAIGEGAWAFAFVGTEIHIEAADGKDR